MPLDHEADYAHYLYTCNRCLSCTIDPTAEMRPLCPSYARFGFFTYSGGGKGYVSQGILEGKTPVSPEIAEVAMNCLLCGACASLCPPGFDTISFIRDLRDELVGKGIYINERHQNLLDRARCGEMWGKPVKTKTLPSFTGSEELLVFAGCKSRAKGDLLPELKKILKAGRVSWGVPDQEPCCGAPLEELGDRAAFKELAEKNIDRLNDSGVERILTLCPHCAATMTNDYFEVGDLEPEIISLPRYLYELEKEGRIQFAHDKPAKVTFHDPCRLSRFLEEPDAPREVLEAMKGVELLEPARCGKTSWCCGSGAWAAEIVPDLAGYTTRERLREVRAAGADCLVTACAYCTDLLKKAAKGKPKVRHLGELVAERID